MYSKNDVVGFMGNKLKTLDKVACAMLRNGVGRHPSEALDTRKIVLKDAPSWVNLDDMLSNDELAVYIALTLYGLHSFSMKGRTHIKGVSFGSAVAHCVNKKKALAKIIKTRFDFTISTENIQKLAHNAIGLVKHCSIAGVGFDYAMFAEELANWQDNAKEIRYHWAIDFVKDINDDRKYWNEYENGYMD